jgi:hypothetical protein
VRVVERWNKGIAAGRDMWWSATTRHVAGIERLALRVEGLAADRTTGVGAWHCASRASRPSASQAEAF